MSTDRIAIEYAKVISAHRHNSPVYQRSQSGYGSKLNTSLRVRIEGETRHRTVYAICYSNCASFYVITKGKRLFIRDCDLP